RWIAARARPASKVRYSPSTAPPARTARISCSSPSASSRLSSPDRPRRSHSILPASRATSHVRRRQAKHARTAVTVGPAHREARRSRDDLKRPLLAAQRQRLTDVLGAHTIAAREVGDGPRHLEDALVAPGAELGALVGRGKHRLALLVERGIPPDELGVHVGVAADTRALQARGLALACLDDGSADLCRLRAGARPERLRRRAV